VLEISRRLRKFLSETFFKATSIDAAPPKARPVILWQHTCAEMRSTESLALRRVPRRTDRLERAPSAMRCEGLHRIYRARAEYLAQARRTVVGEEGEKMQS